MPAVVTKPTKSKKKLLTWDAAIDHFETHLRAKRSSVCTLKEYLPNVRHLARELGTDSPGHVTLHDLRNLQCRIMSGEASRSKRPPSASTVAGITKCWRSFFRFLAGEKLIAEDPSARLETPRVPKRAPLGVLTVKEVERLLDTPSPFTPKGLRDRAILDLLYSTGLRRAELCALNLTDVDHQEREIVVRCGKGEKGRVLPLTRSAYGRLVDYLERARPVLGAKCPSPTDALLVGGRRGRITGDVIDYLLDKGKIAAGIKKRITPHTLRRTFATTLDRNGVSLRYIQALLGHEHLNTTAIYLKIDKAELRRELLLKHPRERMKS